ncbi:NADP-dependent oxidoreductase [Pseudonocardia eucalypti]|uniref:NADP-dependent oxidoreductase n=1 Tax=Pseudonocardia eucalypti TaxID=648755 RepID=A0ABP9Q0F3_9PSEU|nr:NADPH-dependent curcumin reductase CurA [Pseudonocardia eucalypti]
MSTSVNHQVRLAARPVGEPKPSDWALVEEPVPTPADGQLVIKVSHISVDPAMRGWMDDRPSYLPPVGLNDVMRALGAGEVVASNHPKFPVGQHVTGMFGVQEYVVSDGTALIAVDPGAVPMPTYLAALGMTGMTAYFGFFDVGVPKPGDTVLVSGAAGAVGSLVGQLAKIHGCRAVGIAGGAEKCEWVRELGFDAALDYREPNLAGRIREATPDGVQVYFDNVGGEILDLALARLTVGARVVLCGAISQYNAREQIAGPKNYLSLLINRARMEGFIVTDFYDRYPEGAAAMAGWLREGKLQSREDVVGGSVADFPETLLKLFRGENIGKLVLKLT